MDILYTQICVKYIKSPTHILQAMCSLSVNFGKLRINEYFVCVLFLIKRDLDSTEEEPQTCVLYGCNLHAVCTFYRV